MTDEQINIAIAEACGWQIIPEYYHGDDQPPEYTTVTPHGERLCGYYPDYCNDLNAMHEAEMSLPVEGFNGQEWDRSRSEFREWLRLICLQPCHATARERAEAFLRTVDKWEEFLYERLA